MLKQIMFIIALISLSVILGCTQENGTEIQCIDYCSERNHTDCSGSWGDVGEYPNCNCTWTCTEDVVTDDEVECTTNWTCTNWTDCSIQSLQTRTCTDLNDCNVTTDKPSESQACTYANPCDAISSGSIKSRCNTLLFEDVSYCLDSIYEACVFEFAKISFNLTLCELINTSYTRNSCKAILSNSKVSCNILEPALRQDCYNSIDSFLENRARIEKKVYYCNLITNTTKTSSCLNIIKSDAFLNHLNNYTICERYYYDSNNTDYQQILACFAYHVKEGVNPCESVKNVVNLTTVFYDECNALVENNINYCYAFNETRRDNCFANFAYLRSDPLLCRDATNYANCTLIGCNYLEDINFCNRISDTTQRNRYTYGLLTACLTYNWKTCDMDSCSLLSDQSLKDSCIYDSLKQSKLDEGRYSDHI